MTVENDANSAAIAELHSGCLQGTKEAVAVILGSSIGGAVIHNGKVHYGTHYCAAEFSLIKVDSADDSLNHLWRNINGKNGLLRLVQRHLDTTEKFTGIEIFDMANAGNEKALDALDEYCRLLAIRIYNLQAVYDTSKFAIGGGISAQPLLFKLLNKHLDRIFEHEKPYGLAVFKPEIVSCRYHNDSNLIGALYTFLEQSRGV